MLMLTMPNSSFSVSILKHSPKPTVQQVPSLKLETANMASKQLLSHLQTHHLQTPRIFLSWPCLKQESIHVLSNFYGFVPIMSVYVHVPCHTLSYYVYACRCIVRICLVCRLICLAIGIFWVLGASDWFGVALGGSCAPPVLGGSTKSQDDFY